MTSLVPVLIAALLAGAGPTLDTVFLRNGGRVRGTVVEEDPGRGVSIQLPGGELRKLLPSEIARVEYADGPAAAVPAPQEPTDASRRDAATTEPSAGPAGPIDTTPLPPVEPLPRAERPRPPAPDEGIVEIPTAPRGFPEAVTFAASVFQMSAGGDAQRGVPMKDFTSAMGGLGLEAGVRLDEHVVLGAYLDFAGGSPGPELEAECAFNGVTCSTGDVKLGLLGRYAFTPSSWHTPWVGLGIGMDVLMALPDDPELDGPSYGGFEPLRVSAGWDYRGNGTLGVGLFAIASWSRYADVDSDGNGDYETLQDRRAHTWLQVGVRGILFP
jgi:hypothetical protein